MAAKKKAGKKSGAKKPTAKKTGAKKLEAKPSAAKKASRWPFTDAENFAVIASKRIVEGEDWIYCVTHDAEDGMWQFHPSSGPTPMEEARVVGLGEIVKMDGRVKELADLPTGWWAWRETEDAEWTRGPKKDE